MQLQPGNEAFARLARRVKKGCTQVVAIMPFGDNRFDMRLATLGQGDSDVHEIGTTEVTGDGGVSEVLARWLDVSCGDVYVCLQRFETTSGDYKFGWMVLNSKTLVREGMDQELFNTVL